MQSKPKAKPNEPSQAEVEEPDDKLIVSTLEPIRPRKFIEQQSPVNVAHSIPSTYRRDVLLVHWEKRINGFSVHSPHGLKILFEPDPNCYLTMKGKRFQLKEFHFHHPSEHYVNGRRSSMELHIVHQNYEDNSAAVLAIFLNVADKAQTRITRHDELALAELLKAAKNRVGSGNFGFSTDPHDWLPGDLSHFYRYEGSLTTEPFTEAVTWTVFETARTFSVAHLSELIKETREGARDIQQINRRYIIEYRHAIKAFPTNPATGELASRRTGRKRSPKIT